MQRIDRILLAKEFGWTLDYIDSLDPFDLSDVWGVLDGQAKLRQTGVPVQARKGRR